MGNVKIIVIASVVSFLIGGGIFFGIVWCTSNFNYITDEEAAQLSTMRWLMQDKLQEYNIQDDMNHVSCDNMAPFGLVYILLWNLYAHFALITYTAAFIDNVISF